MALLAEGAGGGEDLVGVAGGLERWVDAFDNERVVGRVR